MAKNQSKPRFAGPRVAVEIGSDWLKIVQVEHAHGRPTVSKLHVDAIRDSGIPLSRVLTDACQRLKIASVPVIVCLPRQTVNMRMLELPSTDPQEIVDMVDLQAAKQTPYSTDEIISDYRVTGGGRAGYTRVLLAIAQRSALRQRFYVLDEAGIEVDRMPVSSEGLMGWFRAAPKLAQDAETVALLDVDASYSDFVVLSRRELVFTKSIMIGAAQLRADFGKWSDKLGREVQQAQEIFQGENPGIAVSKVFLTGAGLFVDGLAGELGRFCNVPVGTADIAGGVALQAGLPSMQDEPYRNVSMTALVGVALAADEMELDLIPDTVRSKKDIVAKAKRLTLFGMLLFVTLASISLLATMTYFMTRTRLLALRAEVRRTNPVVRRIEQQRKALELMGQRNVPSLLVVNLLEAVYELTGDVYLDAVDYDAEKGLLSVEGTAKALKDVSGLVQRLEQSPLFVDVREGRTQVDAKGNFEFQIVCGLEKKP